MQPPKNNGISRFSHSSSYLSHPKESVQDFEIDTQSKLSFDLPTDDMDPGAYWLTMALEKLEALESQATSLPTASSQDRSHSRRGSPAPASLSDQTGISGSGPEFLNAEQIPTANVSQTTWHVHHLS